MAHNAAFEDSWFKIHLDGYAEARRAGKIIVIDSRQICRSLDADVRSLPRESAPAAGSPAAGPPYVPQIDLPSQILNPHFERFRPIPDTQFVVGW